ncbi:coagulation factor IXb [Centropristis striata]|uniref:coagulation factor IXb n=1 Tax=Centropristis striata TaxID=184440 RepID=UPI0027DEC0B8|nr:coagulation factor IXb [Centropristis striata]
MVGVGFLTVVAALLLQVSGLPAGAPQGRTGSVFVSRRAADTVLRRLRRYNSPLEEVLHKDNLERECMEETCSMEEAREWFEDNDKTMAFWAGYIDGDQCQPPPCQNGGVCEDGVSSYTCLCQTNFGGKNCEIEVYKQCQVNNGGCSHFCAMAANIPVCKCAVGYKLGANKRSCEPTEEFSCGRVLPPSAAGRSFFTPHSSNATHRSEGKLNSSDAPDDYVNYEDMTEFYDDLDLHANDSDSSNVSEASGVRRRSARSDSGSSLTTTEEKQLPSWAFFATQPTITAEKKHDERIVGGSEVVPGEIPWQVALMSHSASLQRAMPFCGGSLLSDLWVITAAHCLTNPVVIQRGFFIRAGEHDVTQAEGPERDHQVAEQHIHSLYNDTVSPYNHDIALLKLASPVELSRERSPICLGPKDFTENLVRDSSVSLVSGWGQISFRGPQAPKLQKVEVPYVDRTKCKQSSREQVTRFMFCAGYLNKHMDSCKGDSGGPHVTNYKGTWFLTGIVSWGEDCAKDGKYGIYTRVSRYYNWLSRTTGLRIPN